MVSLRLLRSLMVCLWVGLASPPAIAFILDGTGFEPWLSTASGTRSGNGQPVTLTWSIVGDGTSTPNDSGSTVGSDLISFLDTTIGGNPAGGNANDLTQRPWFDTFRQPFDRWEALSGIDFVYEPNDDNRVLGDFGGQLGTRGDIRVGGRNIDGPSGTLAFAFTPNGFPSDGEVVFDTSESSFYGNSAGDYLPLRNTLAHELGHSLNMRHLNSPTDELLLEPSINTSFDGPQLDEVRAAHFYYGDKNEKSFGGLGNSSAARATNLGTLFAGSTKRVGTSADVPNQTIAATVTDFVSVSNLSDADYFSFTTTQPGMLDALLRPLGGVFSQGGEGEIPASFNANSRSDLVLTIFGTNGVTPLITVDLTNAGGSEAIANLSLPSAGKYYARVTGLQDTIQLYQLDLSLSSGSFGPADLNTDGFVDGQDLGMLLSNWGQFVVSGQGELSGTQPVDGLDLGMLLTDWNPSPLPVQSLATVGVPEPRSIGMLTLAVAALVVGRREWQCRVRAVR